MTKIACKKCHFLPFLLAKSVIYDKNSLQKMSFYNKIKL